MPRSATAKQKQKPPPVPSPFDEIRRQEEILGGVKSVGGEKIDAIRLDVALSEQGKSALRKELGLKKKDELPETMSLERLIELGITPGDFSKVVERDLLDKGLAASGAAFVESDLLGEKLTGLAPELLDLRVLAKEKAMELISFDPSNLDDPKVQSASFLAANRFRGGLSAFGPVTAGQSLQESQAVQATLLGLDAALEQQGTNLLSQFAPEAFPAHLLQLQDKAFQRQLFQNLVFEQKKQIQKAAAMLQNFGLQAQAAAAQSIPILVGGGLSAVPNLTNTFWGLNNPGVGNSGGGFVNTSGGAGAVGG